MLLLFIAECDAVKFIVKPYKIILKLLLLYKYWQKYSHSSSDILRSCVFMLDIWMYEKMVIYHDSNILVLCRINDEIKG